MALGSQLARWLAGPMLAASLSLPAQAQTSIAPGGAASGSVNATTSIYQIFGHSGTDYTGQAASTTSAPYLSFGVSDGSHAVFSFSAVSGGTNCCGVPHALSGPDGAAGTTNVKAYNGLSGVIGNTQLGLVAVFTSETDPFGSTAPATLSWDAAALGGQLKPALNQVFHGGDGRAGLHDSTGALLSFSAPAGATRLYSGLADSYSFQGLPSYYGDNQGALAYTVSMAPVPEPTSGALLMLGLASMGALLRRRRGR